MHNRLKEKAMHILKQSFVHIINTFVLTWLVAAAINILYYYKHLHNMLEMATLDAAMERTASVLK